MGGLARGWPELGWVACCSAGLSSDGWPAGGVNCASVHALYVLCPADEAHVVFAGESGMSGQDANAVGDAAAFSRLQADIVAVRAVEFAFGVLHRQGELRGGVVVIGFTVDKFDAQVFGLQVVRAHPGFYVEPLAQAQLPLALPIGVELDARPVPVDLLLPGRQHAGLFIVILLDGLALLDLWHVEARTVLLHHTAHAELWRARSHSLFHYSDPGVGDTVRIALVVGGDDFLFQQLIE